ncbi:hypothetical protein ALI144C_44935 [Actinosynnema sp. ALI-1.44]|uniref:hypothetical protein n=1 Tax=Actinosynnema sp. ALI-1.44 TaxID=1933779 RepID=UPI00097C2EC3|nr:hypothetical protein [Actinosynnema sp. ALI-1.44]ONI73099.1 hypothetical protein ALI144C_44935 [Actinosynnema sp. ALI-1.44]
MKIRTMGTADECQVTTERIRAAFNVLEVSDFQPRDRNRRTPGSKLGYVYIDVNLDTPPPVHATAVRTDRRQIGSNTTPEET